MGSVMVEHTASTALNQEPKKLHPFFTAPRTIQPDAHSSDSADLTLGIGHTCAPAEINEHSENNGGTDDSEASGPKRKRRKAAVDTDQECDDAKKPRRGRKKGAAQGVSIVSLFSKANGDPTGPEAPEQADANQDNIVPDKKPAASIESRPELVAAEGPDESASKGVEEEDANTKSVSDNPPKKMLQLNRKAGTIGSPPKPKELKPSRQPEGSTDTVEDMKKPTSKEKQRPSRTVTITYAKDDMSRARLGAMIDMILNRPPKPRGEEKTRTRIRRPHEAKKAQAAGVKMAGEAMPKDPHPFFTGKAKAAGTVASAASPGPNGTPAVKAKSGPAPPRPRIFSSTPCSPRKNRNVTTGVPLPNFGVRSLGLKTPGARLPAWPPKDMVHIRGTTDDPLPLPHPLFQPTARKSKGNTIHITPQEMVLSSFARRLQIAETVQAVKNINTETFSPPPPGLRLPKKHFESGVKLERRVLGEVRNAQHPALADLRVSLTSSLSAFDKYQCESVAWAQKYSPKAAIEVLQYGKDAFYLRDWLQALKVQSVDTGEVKPKPLKPPKKKRKKNRLDDFIVDSDEEANAMDEVSDPEEDWSPDKRGVKRTVIRTGDLLAQDGKTSSRLTNTVVISGPHGCGKTSAVYAAAKELDYEVFEINPGSRRSGKDILEKIGDMTRNHLVQHHQNDASATAIDEEEIAEDIKSGKQSTVNSFFQVKATARAGRPKKVVEESTPRKSEPKKSTPKSQKQSLILLDEVDILYDEDKQFWTTVISLIAQSKRPFVMTCNEEDVVPLQALSLHGIFRFSAPPVDLAVDRLLMIAACEGHALRRSAVEALYQARQQDLRACLADLNYWCQIAVGDRRGGLDWFYPRWPKGCDTDEDGNIVRVVSQNTYVEGMGWLAHEVVAGDDDNTNNEEELLRETWDFWQMDMGDWHESLDLTSWASNLNLNASHRLDTLGSYDEFCEALSIADLCSAMAFKTSTQEIVDCTLPSITPKARDDYTLGRQLLDAPVASTFDPLATALPISLKSLARKSLQTSSKGLSLVVLNAVDEASVVSKIQQHEMMSCRGELLDRDDFSSAFDILASSEKTASSGTGNLDLSVFDGSLCNIVVDVAPYVRSIVNYEKGLQKQRQKLSSLMSQGGTKRMRNTRASHAALEGGSRSTTRRDKWFTSSLNDVLVMRTAGEGWAEAIETERPSSASDSRCSAGSAEGIKATKGRSRRVISEDGDDEGASSSGTDIV